MASHFCMPAKKSTSACSHQELRLTQTVSFFYVVYLDKIKYKTLGPNSSKLAMISQVDSKYCICFTFEVLEY